MSGLEALPAPAGLVTRASLLADLAALGVRPGSVLLVHAAMSPLGWVCGGPVTVIQALLDAVGTTGTLVVPTFTGTNSDPSHWTEPAVPETWWPTIRAQLPGFHPRITPSHRMGVIAETVRSWPGARRSDHPRVSFTAVGARADELTAKHRLAPMLGERSPLARIEAADGDVLLLGVGHAANASLHLARYRVPGFPRREHGAAQLHDGARSWVTWSDLLLDRSEFPAIGAAFDAEQDGVLGPAGGGQARLMRQAALVAFATRWLERTAATAGSG